jgi:hydrogenase maturation factor
MNNWTKKKPDRPRLAKNLFLQQVSQQENLHRFCPACTDEALPGRVTQIFVEHNTALVEINGEAVEVDVSLLDQVSIGQTLFVHGGVAIGSREAGAQ